jgi:hypothetical protein
MIDQISLHKLANRCSGGKFLHRFVGILRPKAWQLE